MTSGDEVPSGPRDRRSDLPDDVVGEVRRTLHDLRRVELAPTAWPAVAGDLARLAATVDHGNVDAVRQTLVPLSQAAFEGKVRGRLAGAGSRAPAVAPTKGTSALPIVGLVCAALLLGVGYALGGVVVLAGTAVLAVFVFAVALAGTRAAKAKAEALRMRRLAPSAERTERAPTVVRSAIAGIEEQLG